MTVDYNMEMHPAEVFEEATVVMDDIDLWSLLFECVLDLSRADVVKTTI